MTEPESFTFEDDGAVPNTRLPLLVYRAAVPADPEAIEQLFERNQWPPGMAQRRASVPSLPQQCT